MKGFRSFKNEQKLLNHLREKDLVFWRKFRGKVNVNYYQLIIFLQLVLKIHKISFKGVDGYSFAVIEDNCIRLIEIADISKLIVEYFEQNFDKANGVVDVNAVLGAVVENSYKFYTKNIESFFKIETIELKIDSEKCCYLQFENTLIEITSSGINQIKKTDFGSPLLHNRLIKRDFQKLSDIEKGVFYQFVWNLAGQNEQRFLVLITTLGYLVHDYKDPVNPKIVVLIDQVTGDNQISNGGTGKSLLLKALSYVISVVELGGKRLQSSHRFAFQKVKIFTQLVLINDASKKENLDNYFNLSTDTFEIEEKYKSTVSIPFEYSPKIATTTNHFLNRSEGNSTERRLHEIEVSPYYGKHLTPQAEFGHNFFTDWDDEQWLLFDNFIVHCVHTYLSQGLVEPVNINLEERKLYAEVGLELVEFLDEKIEQRVQRFHKADLYEEFRKGGYTQPKYVPRRNNFTHKVKKYLHSKNIAFTETPANTKKYIELSNGDSKQSQPIQTIVDVDTQYKIVDTPNKLTRFINNINKEDEEE